MASSSSIPLAFLTSVNLVIPNAKVLEALPIMRRLALVITGHEGG